MNNTYELARQVFLNYYVIFKSSSHETDYQPIISMEREIAKSYFLKNLHQFDTELENVLPAFWYILYLPRIGFDVHDLKISMLKNSYDVPHNIISIPSSAVDTMIKFIDNNKLSGPTLIIYEDGCHENARRMNELLKPHLGSYCVSELSSELLTEHWFQVGNMMKNLSEELLMPDRSMRLLNKDEFLANE